MTIFVKKMEEIKKITVVYFNGKKEVLFEAVPRVNKRKATLDSKRHTLLLDCYSGKEKKGITYNELIKEIRIAYFNSFSEHIGLNYCKEIIGFYKKNNWIKNEPRKEYYLNI